MPRFLLICIVFFWSTITIQAQNYELGKITIAELNEKVHPKDSSAPAAILFKKVTYFSLSQNKIQIVSQKEINNSIFAAEDYEMIKEFFQKMIVSQNEKIILKKI